MSEGNPLAKGAAWMNGEIMPINKARLPVNDWGILHSDITYDVVPVRDGAFFRLPDYMERFRASRASLRLDIGMDEAAISAALHRMVAASGLRDSYVAMVASRGVPLIPGTRDPRECGNHFYSCCSWRRAVAAPDRRWPAGHACVVRRGRVNAHVHQACILRPKFRGFIAN